MSGSLTISQNSIPTLTNEQMREVIRIMVEEFGLSHQIMMENVGRNLANLTRRLLGGELLRHHVAVLVGAGHCGAAGLAAARFLHNAGADLTIILSRPPSDMSHLALHQYRILSRIGVAMTVQTQLPPLKILTSLRQAEITLDALIGGGLRGIPTGTEAFLIQALRQVGRPVLALDLPSGFPGDGGRPVGPFVRAEATLALALPRLGHVNAAAAPFLGELYLADIGVPPMLYQRLGFSVGSIFSVGEIIYLRKKEK
ncbi:MAG: NAD(P)H-hydrate epimerase [Chloroflexota bacterium]|nr:NAD(P)H-hydrate epimerase [Chloroflexota bacterium]